MTVRVEYSGPFFDGRADALAQDFAEDWEWQVGAQGLADWSANLDASIQHPTPYYETQTTVQQLNGHTEVHDRGIVYGPWLEGLGSRNRTTRFRGYFALRNAARTTEARAVELGETLLRNHYLRGMN